MDDDDGLRTVLTGAYEDAGFEVLTASRGREALRAFYRDRVDLVLLDLGLPDLDGLTVLRRIRDVAEVPVLVLTARSDEDSKVLALSLGADDVVTKPFGVAELIARTRALLRRRPSAGHEVLDDGVLRLDLAGRQAWVSGRRVSVTPIEWRLLVAFATQPGVVLGPDDLLGAAWPTADGGVARVKFAIQRLRRRLGWTDVTTSPLQVVRGFGYRYQPLDAPHGR